MISCAKIGTVSGILHLISPPVRQRRARSLGLGHGGLDATAGTLALAGMRSGRCGGRGEGGSRLSRSVHGERVCMWNRCQGVWSVDYRLTDYQRPLVHIRSLFSYAVPSHDVRGGLDDLQDDGHDDGGGLSI